MKSNTLRPISYAIAIPVVLYFGTFGAAGVLSVFLISGISFSKVSLAVPAAIFGFLPFSILTGTALKWRSQSQSITAQKIGVIASLGLHWASSISGIVGAMELWGLDWLRVCSFRCGCLPR